MEEFLRTEQLKGSPLFQNRRCLNNIQTKQNKTKNLTRIFKQRFIVVSSQAHSSGSQPRWPLRCQSLCGRLSCGPSPARSQPAGRSARAQGSPSQPGRRCQNQAPSANTHVETQLLLLTGTPRGKGFRETPSATLPVRPPASAEAVKCASHDSRPDILSGSRRKPARYTLTLCSFRAA